MKHLKIDCCAYFLTTCIYERKNTLANPQHAQVVLDAIIHGKTQKWYFLLGYVVMFDHFHLIVIPKNKTIPEIMKSIKGYSARMINQLIDHKGQIWQDGYYDVVLDNIKYVNQKLRYIEENPIRAGLVTKPVDYRFSSAGKYELLDLSVLY